MPRVWLNGSGRQRGVRRTWSCSTRSDVMQATSGRHSTNTHHRHNGAIARLLLVAVIGVALCVTGCYLTGLKDCGFPYNNPKTPHEVTLYFLWRGHFILSAVFFTVNLIEAINYHFSVQAVLRFLIWAIFLPVYVGSQALLALLKEEGARLFGWPLYISLGYVFFAILTIIQVATIVYEYGYETDCCEVAAASRGQTLPEEEDEEEDA